jgi:hypothetical protein
VYEGVSMINSSVDNELLLTVSRPLYVNQNDSAAAIGAVVGMEMTQSTLKDLLTYALYGNSSNDVNSTNHSECQQQLAFNKVSEYFFTIFITWLNCSVLFNYFVHII